MPSLKVDGHVGYNTQIHNITLEDNTIVSGAMNNPRRIENLNLDPNPSVNSVHWLVPDARTKPNHLLIRCHGELR